MVPYTIAQCTVADGAALAHNNIPPNFLNQHWNLTWPHRTLEYHISQVAKRMPRTLLDDRECKRHQKALDPQTGHLLGYARWDIPASHATNPDGNPEWPEAVVPAVGPEEEAEIRRVADTAHWDPNPNGNKMFETVRAPKYDILARKPYMSA
jgi:hypothetical protein